MRTRLATVATIAAFAAAAGVSSERALALDVVGTGNLSCGKWLESRDQKNEAQSNLMVQWVAGFLVSYNYYLTGKKEADAKLDLTAIAYFLDKWCRDHPTAPAMFMAAAELVQQQGGTVALHNQAGAKKR